MQTVPETPTPRKPLRAFYCQYLGESGYLTRYDGDIIFLAHGSTVPHVIAPADVCGLDVLGEVGTAVAQFVADQLAGGAVGVCTSRRMEV